MSTKKENKEFDKGFIVGMAVAVAHMLSVCRDTTTPHEILRSAGIKMKDLIAADCSESDVEIIKRRLF